MDFGALDFTSPKRNRLAYRMAGLTDRWIDLGTQHRITLTNLEAGDHVLEVRAANADSVWSAKRRCASPSTATPRHGNPAGLRRLCACAALGLIAYRRVRQRRNSSRSWRHASAWSRRWRCELAELLESNRQLAEAARAKSNFLDRMSHELRTPMNGVVGMTELLAHATVAMQTRLTQTIRSSAQVLLQIVNDLLDLSKIQAGKVELESLPLDLVALLEECTSLFYGRRRGQGHRTDRVSAGAGARQPASGIRCACGRS
jgi:signal transduction histidine kinase